MNDIAKAALEVTRQWAVEELETARVRVTNLRIGGQAYNDSIDAVERLSLLIEHLDYSLAEPTPLDYEPPKLTVVEPEQEPTPEPEPEPPRVVDISELRTKAMAAKEAGIKVTDVWAKFGVNKLSELPGEHYAEAVDILTELLEELG